MEVSKKIELERPRRENFDNTSFGTGTRMVGLKSSNLRRKSTPFPRNFSPRLCALKNNSPLPQLNKYPRSRHWHDPNRIGV